MDVWLFFVGSLAWLLETRFQHQLEHAVNKEAAGFDGKP